MNLNRLKSNLVNRDWSSKTTKTNISYIKGKLKQFGLTTPKYLDNGKLTNKQIQTQTKRIVNAINREKDVLRKEANKPTFEKAMKELERVVNKHNQLVYKKLNYVFEKYNLSENQMNFLIGRDVSTDGYKMQNKIVIKRQNSQFEIIDLTNVFEETSFRPFRGVPVKGIVVEGIADKSNSWFNELGDFAKSIGMSAGVGYFKVNDDMSFNFSSSTQSGRVPIESPTISGCVNAAL